MLTLEIKQPRRIRWFTINRVFHNLLSQAYTYWYSDGQKHYEVYYVNCKYHRDPNLGPAITHWYQNGQKSRECFYVNGK
jgi:antitoxin component YwqK of YwqJK toxin-antitoxin module